jgi:Flp pilus assembly protein TadG
MVMRLNVRGSGQSLVEFALVIGMFTLLMLGLFDWSRTFGTYISLTNATREAARQTQVATRTTDPMTTVAAQPIVNQAMAAFTLPLGPGQFTAPADVCLFAAGTVLSATTTNPCDPADNGGNTPAASAAGGTGAILAVHASYTVHFLPLMSAVLPNGLTFSAATVTVLE